MSAQTQHDSLPNRWLAAAAADPSTDVAILQLIERSYKDGTINEAALLRAMLEHAEKIVDEDNASTNEAEGDEVGGAA